MWVPLTPAGIPVPAVVSVLSFISTAMVSAPVTLAAAVIVNISVTQLASFSMTCVSAPLVIPPGLTQLVVTTSTNIALSLPYVISHLIPLTAVANEVDVTRSYLSS